MAIMCKKKPPAPAPTAIAASPAAIAALAQQQQAPGTALGPPAEAIVAELCGMGFPRDQVLSALRSAFNNPDRAMEYLLDGNIPAPPPDSAPPLQASASTLEGMLGPQLLTKNGFQPTSQALGGASVVLLYFSAHWCPPCQRFTPELARAFSALGSPQAQVQVVFVSSDRDQGSFAEYYSHMPWIALPFGGPQAQVLSRTFNVSGIPAVVALDGRTGRVLDANARNAITTHSFDLLACCRAWGIAQSAPAPAVPAAPAVAATPAKKPEPEATAIDTLAAEAALQRIAALEVSVQESFYSTILKVLNNALQNPQDPKYRSLKKGNAALQSKLFAVGDGAAVALLLLGGFEDSEEAIGLTGAPDGRCTAVRDAIQAHAEEEKMNQLRKERDARIAEQVEKDKGRAPERRFGGGDDGRHNIGRGKPSRGGGG